MRGRLPLTQSKATTVQAYLASLPDDRRAALHDVLSNILVRDNHILGDGACALQIGTFQNPLPASATTNACVLNDITQFQASVADVFLDINSAHTVLFDQAGTLLDHGTGTTTLVTGH